VDAWWAERPFSNIGLNCGRSGLVVIDIDPRNGGRESFRAWRERTQWAVPPLLTATTPSGGYHLYYAVEDGLEVPRKGRLAPGVDLQAAGGYVVMPPSVLLHGDYRWAEISANAVK
jgi:hypothetical protein